MSNTEIISNDQWPDRPLTEAQQRNRQAADLIPFGEHGISPQSFAQVVDMAKMMATARGAVPKHLVGNTGACLAVIELGQKFQMSAYMLAMGCFSVNDMLAFTGQTIMAVMNKHLPLAKDADGNKTRLKYVFEGEHGTWEIRDAINDRGEPVKERVCTKPSTRRITVSGRMANETDVLEYTSPMVKDIRNKKSPLWEEDEDQQLIYWASRRWQRRWWPEGLLGIYDNEELVDRQIGADNAKLVESSNNPGQALLDRVAAAKAQTADADKVAGVTQAREGFTADHAHNETTNGAEKSEMATAPIEETAAADVPPADGWPGPVVTDGVVATGSVAEPEPEPEHIVLPTTVAEWKVYAEAWINKAKADPTITPDDMNKFWKSEIGLRNDCSVPGSPAIRDQVYDLFLEVRDSKPKPAAAAKTTKPKKQG